MLSLSNILGVQVPVVVPVASKAGISIVSPSRVLGHSQVVASVVEGSLEDNSIRECSNAVTALVHGIVVGVRGNDCYRG